MAKKLITSLNLVISKIEEVFASNIFDKLQLGLLVTNINYEIPKPAVSKMKDIWHEGFLWAVPKHRRPLQKRLNRKFGWPQYNWKPLVLKTNLIMCKTCGHFHESNNICGHCYEKVKVETAEIQKVITKELKLDPIKDDIVVLYEDENYSKSEDYWKHQRIIEMPKKRPSWFHSNLLQPTSQKDVDSNEIKPNDLA